jgi:hypothetical protein
MSQPPAPPPPPGAAGGYGGTRPGPVLAAIIMLFAVGGIQALLYLIGLFALFGVLGVGAIVYIAILITLILIAVGVFQIIAGMHALRGTARGQRLGVVSSAVGAGLFLLFLIISLANATVAVGGGLVFSVIFIAADIVIVVLLTQNKQHFVA